MINTKLRVIWTVLALFVGQAIFAACLAQVPAKNPKDGQVRENSEDYAEAWDGVAKQWVGLESFWRSYSTRRGGLTWGSRTEYPPYSKVREYDTMIINLPSGPCMMEFFHSRWRRANDVRRWDESFDEYGGCPHVFD